MAPRAALIYLHTYLVGAGLLREITSLAGSPCG